MILLTGATGYVGGRLLQRLEQEGLAVKCLCRDPEALRWRVAPGTELVRGDLLQPASLDSVFLNVDTAIYLVHSMNSGEKFEYPVFWGADLQSEHERWLTETKVGRPVILTVDDHLAMHDVYALAFERNYDQVRAYGGQEALKIVRAEIGSIRIVAGVAEFVIDEGFLLI